MKKPHLPLLQKFQHQQPTIIFHPNLTLPFSHNQHHSPNPILHFIPKPHIIKLSHQQIQFITPKQNHSQPINSFFKPNLQPLIYTKPPNPPSIYLKHPTQKHQKPLNLKPIDTTPPPHPFIPAVITKILQQQPIHIPKFFKNYPHEILKFTNNLPPQLTTKYPPIQTIPTLPHLQNQL